MAAKRKDAATYSGFFCAEIGSVVNNRAILLHPAGMQSASLMRGCKRSALYEHSGQEAGMTVPFMRPVCYN